MDYKILTYKNKRYITVPKIEDLGLRHVFTTIDMDVGMKTNKSIEDIKNNISLVYKLLEIRPEILYNGYQSHTKNIEIIKDTYQGEESPFGRYLPNTDGLITDKKDIALITRFADCTPILLYDHFKNVQANIHSGWRGTLQKIGANGIDLMKNEYNCDPKDILVVLGPSIEKDDFEVDLDVKELFEDKFNYKDIIFKKENAKFLIDLKTINKRTLIEKGIKEENIIDINLSTFSNSALLHSYRRDKEKYGLMGLITCL